MTVVCSASPEFEIKPILEQLGADYIIGTKVDTETGKFVSPNCKGEEKVRRIKELLGECEFRNAYTDNVKSDAPMLELAENKFKIESGRIIRL